MEPDGSGSCQADNCGDGFFDVNEECDYGMDGENCLSDCTCADSYSPDNNGYCFYSP